VPANIRPVPTTVVISDLHLGITTGADLARRAEVRERLASAVADADRLVLLGDLLELRERPLIDVLDLARPLIEELGEALAGREAVIVPGNHDHHLVEPWLTRGRLSRGELGPEGEWPVGPGDGAAGLIAEWMPRVELSVAYPGLRPRDDVYAIHGHYLDVHLTAPRLESIAASVMARVAVGRSPGCRSVADYEAALGPLYAFFDELAQGAGSAAMSRGGTVSRRVWHSVNDGGRRRLSRLLLGRVTIPGAVAILNRAGVGPFSPDISGPELRRAGLRAMAKVLEGMGIEAEHVVFGHTHRAGPLERDDERDGWITPDGTRLWNSGSWLHEEVFLGDGGSANPYWPGHVIRVGDSGPPQIENVLRDLELVPR
jgi:predicted phosphodiesterase